MLLKTGLTIASLGLALIVSGQIERSAFTSTGRGIATTFVHDYQSIGINPANLAWANEYNKRVTFGLVEGGATFYAEALERQEFRQSLVDFDESLTQEEKVAFARDFANSELSMDVDMQLLGISVDFNDRKWGAAAFSIRDRIHYNSNFNTEASEILFTGWNASYFDLLRLDGPDGPIIENTGNLSADTLSRVVQGISTSSDLASQIFNGSRLKSIWYREFNFSYGREVFSTENWMLGAGVGIKYLQGIAFLDIEVDPTSFNAIGATTPSFGINYGEAASSNPSSVNPDDNTLPTAVGSGFGFDFGLNFQFKDKLRIGAALNDIGSVNWKGNVYEASDTLVFDIENDGFNSLNVLSEIENISGEQGVFKQEGVSSTVIALPTNFRIGASYKVLKNLHVGADFFMSLNDAPGSFRRPVYGIGGDYSPFKWLRLSAGYLGGGNYAGRIPLGITFIAGNGTWEAGVASRDLVTFLRPEGATISASFGFLRFRVGKIAQVTTEALY
jgi:hypothetical protein